VEYAFVIVLIAIVSIVAAFLIGLAVQRIYGIVTGALGTKGVEIRNGKYIEITTAQCMVWPAQNITGLWVVGISNEEVGNLTGSTELAVGTGIDGAASPVEINGTAPNFKFHPLLAANVADGKFCPTSIVIQSKSGAIAVSPVTTVTIP
jgi:hypothetical protein